MATKPKAPARPPMEVIGRELGSILGHITGFERDCRREKYTDRDQAWQVLHACRDAARRAVRLTHGPRSLKMAAAPQMFAALRRIHAMAERARLGENPHGAEYARLLKIRDAASSGLSGLSAKRNKVRG